MSSTDGRPGIRLVGGSYFSYVNPEQNVFTIYDIAHHLSMLCCFAGSVTSHFSVAQHSVIVSRLCPLEHALVGLLHDMAEMAMVDVPGPLKKLLPDYKRIEERVERAMFAKMNLPYPMHPAVKEADILARYVEQRDLMPVHIDHWAECDDLDLEAIAQHPKIVPLPSKFACDLFLREYQKLTGKRIL